jgi:hypothetical protein
MSTDAHIIKTGVRTMNNSGNDKNKWKIVSQLTRDGYFYGIEHAHDNCLPNGAVDLLPPILKPLQAALINDEKNGWIIEDDPDGCHAPAFDFNDVEQQTLMFDDCLSVELPKINHPLAAIRALARNAAYKISTKDGEKFFTFRGVELQNRIFFLVENVNFAAQEVVSAYNTIRAQQGMTSPNLIYRTKFGIEQSVYCMKLTFDYLIQIACWKIYENLEIDSLGCFLESLQLECCESHKTPKRNKNTLPAEDVRKLIFKRFSRGNFNFLCFLNSLANCYKHSFLQAFADRLHGEDVLLVMGVHRKGKNKDVVTALNCQYFHLIHAFRVSLMETMNSIKDSLPEDVHKHIVDAENSPFNFV